MEHGPCSNFQVQPPYMVHGFMCPRSIPNPNPSSVVKLLSRSNSGSNQSKSLVLHLIHLKKGTHIVDYLCCCHKVNPSSNKALLKPTTYITFLLNFEGGEPLRRGG